MLSYKLKMKFIFFEYSSKTSGSLKKKKGKTFGKNKVWSNI